MNSIQPGISDSAKLIRSFVPVILQNKYAHATMGKKGNDLPEDHVTLLWIDLCNFSPLCSRLMKDPVIGIEKITGILRNHYDYVLSLITEYGGQPLFFAGDGLMSAWLVDNEAAQSVQAAAACAFRIIRERNTVDDRDELFSLHVLLATGPWKMAELEGTAGSRLVSFFGQVFSDLFLASKNKAPDQVLITDKALSFLSKDLRSKPVESGTSILHDSPAFIQGGKLTNPPLSEEVLHKLKRFVPRTLPFPLREEYLNWMAEIRPVTILFVRLFNNDQTSSESLYQLRKSVALARPLVQKYDGLLNQVWLDEKESNMLICFGPPPSAHIDNPERSVHLGFEIHHLLKKSGIVNSVGLSSGMAYCGILGNDRLRQYTVIGDVVNMSARIAGIKHNAIFCDKATYSAAKKTTSFSEQIKVVLKGRTEPVSLFVPKSITGIASVQPNTISFIGRKRELAILQSAYERARNGKSECIIIEGESGIGKTRLLQEFMLKAPLEDAIKATGSGDFVLRNTPYSALRSIIYTLLKGGYPEELHTNLYDTLLDRFGGKASLLNIVLNTAIPNSEEVRVMTSGQRVQATQNFLLTLLEEVSRKQPLILVIDDARWIDEFTLKLIEAVTENMHACLFILLYQTTEGLTGVQAIKERGAETVLLKELEDEEVAALMLAKLGVANVAKNTVSIMRSISRGNPLFCIEMLGSFFDQELLLFENNTCSFVPEFDINIHRLSLPETVRGAVRRRIDKLGQGAQISLKVSSVVGKRFAEPVVCGIYPIVTERSLVPAYLQEAEQNGFLNTTNVDDLRGYTFNSATTAEVTYEMTLGEQRRQLHRDIAEWYEMNFSERLNTLYVRLANHWIQAQEKDKAASYYEKEAVRIFQLGYVKKALDTGLEGVKQLDYDIPRDLPSIHRQIGENIAIINSLMKGKTIESLADHKTLEDPKTDKVIRQLLSLGPLAHQCQEAEVFALIMIICHRLTLQQGNGESAAEVYAMYSIVYKTITGDSETAFSWSKLSLEVDRKNGFTLQSRVLFIHGWFIALWKLPLRELIPLSSTGADAGLQSGDILFACFNLSLTVILKSTCGINLSEVIETASVNSTRNNNVVTNAAYHLKHEKQVAKALQGLTVAYTSLTDVEYDEKRDIASICESDMFNQIAYYYLSKMKLHVHFGNWDEAVEWGEKSFPLLPAILHQPGQIELEQFYTMAALYKAAESAGDTAAFYLDKAVAGIEKIKAWAEICPANFLHKALLTEAIWEGFQGDAMKAETLFAHAAHSAAAAGYVQDSGLAFEHLFRMQMRKGMPSYTSREAAIRAYQQWQAPGKVRYLLESFPTEM